MPERLHSLSTRTPALTDAIPTAPVTRCQPHCQESRLPESTFAIRKGWLKLRRTPHAGSRDQQAPNIRRCRRCVARFACLGVSTALALALFGPPSALLRAGYGPLGAPFRVNTTTAGDQGYPAIAADASGNYVAVWQGPDENSFARDIYAQRYSSSGAPLGVEFRVNTYTTGDQRVPAVATDAAGDFLVALGADRVARAELSARISTACPALFEDRAAVSELVEFFEQALEKPRADLTRRADRSP